MLTLATDFTLPIREVRAAVGAGFIYHLVGEMQVSHAHSLEISVHRSRSITYRLCPGLVQDL